MEQRVTRCPVCKRPIIVRECDRLECEPDTAEFLCACGVAGTVDWTLLPPRLRDVSDATKGSPGKIGKSGS